MNAHEDSVYSSRSQWPYATVAPKPDGLGFLLLKINMMMQKLLRCRDGSTPSESVHLLDFHVTLQFCYFRNRLTRVSYIVFNVRANNGIPLRLFHE